jgi:capsular polysaccharide biosynthesis protein
MEDEIDLRKYIDVLVKRWKLIAIITGTVIIIAVLVSFLSPPVYEARASVLMTKTRSEIVLEPKYLTEFQQDSTSMRQAMLALVKSSSVANQVIEKLGDKLEPKERKASTMVDKIGVSTQGDLIEISVKSTDPQKAAAIANAWAESYKDYVNRLYSGILQSPEGLKAQAVTAAKEYEEKQKAFEDFIKDNRIAELSQQISDKEILYDTKQLREHVKSGSSSAASSIANGLSLFLLQTKAVTSLPEGLQIPPESLTAFNADLKDVDALISTLETRPGGKRGESLTEVQKDILLLKAELEQENARQRELQDARDIAWEAYTIIAGKSAETEVAAQARGIVVEVADVAAVPESPVAPRRVMNIGIALVLGLVVGVFGAFGAEYFGKTAEQRKDTEES